jgi:alpha-L-fucosidase
VSQPDAQPSAFAPTWESLRQYRVPQWYADAKFGIFIHWGVYAVPAFGSEWYPRNMYQPGTPEFAHHRATYGPQTTFGYKDFIPHLTAARWDPAAWAQLFRAAGARYVVPVAEHHDGFAMSASPHTMWNAARMGPRRDVIGDLAAAVRREGLVFGLSYHRAEHWFFFDGGRRFPSDVQDERYRDLYGPARPAPTDFMDRHAPGGPDAGFLAEWLLRARTLVDQYRPQLVYFDWWIRQDAFQSVLPHFAADYYNQARTWGPDWDQSGAAINYKVEAMPEGTGVLSVERGQLSQIRPLFWQSDTAVAKNSWGYVATQDYKTVDSLIADLVDVVSKNGTLLLNIGPRPDGTIPEPEEAILRAMGRWLAVNGAAIYGARPWRTFGEGPTAVAGGGFTDATRPQFTSRDFRFTTRDGALYAICLGWPEEIWTIRALAGVPVRAVRLLGSGATLDWAQEPAGLTVHPPPDRPCAHAYTLQITMAS